eukprot:gene3943-722_t
MLAPTLVLVAAKLSSVVAGPLPPPAADGDWQWVDMPENKCMTGKDTGVWVRYANPGSKKLAIYLEGGGACFNAFTCNTAANDGHPGAPANAGEFSTTDKRNPYADFNWIWVPYCTGDVHIGQNNETFEGSARTFWGRYNLQRILGSAKATWPSLDNIVLTGESAGGFGTVSNYDYVRRPIYTTLLCAADLPATNMLACRSDGAWPLSTWSDAPHGALVDDSGPVLDDQTVMPCLIENWRQNWNMNASLPPGCPCIGDQGNLVPVWKYTQSKWPHDGIGLISSINDATIGLFFSFGLHGCSDPLPSSYSLLPGGLNRLAASGIPVYMIPGTVHTHTGSNPEFYTKEVNGTYMYQWIDQLVNGNATLATSVVVPSDPVPAKSLHSLCQNGRKVVAC